MEPMNDPFKSLPWANETYLPNENAAEKVKLLLWLVTKVPSLSTMYFQIEQPQVIQLM